jgi:capsular polysaccharide biosynthesis protein
VNLPLYSRVLWRFRLLVVLGFILALTLAFATLAKVSFAQGSLSVSYREQPMWQSTTRLLVTQKGSPWTRSVLPTTGTTPGTGTSSPSNFEGADPGRLVNLAIIYAQLINGTPFQQAVPPGASLNASSVTDPLTQTPLPLIDVAGRGSTRAEAARVAEAGADRFRSYIRNQQASSGVSLNQRALLQVVSTQTQLVAGRKNTLAIVAFLAVMVATVGLVFVLENLRPAMPAAELAAPEQRVPERGAA